MGTVSEVKFWDLLAVSELGYETRILIDTPVHPVPYVSKPCLCGPWSCGWLREELVIMSRMLAIGRHSTQCRGGDFL